MKKVLLKKHVDRVTYYLKQIPSAKFTPVTNDVWDTITNYEGLDEEFNRPLKSQWSMTELHVVPLDKQGLIHGSGDTVEKFNIFDIALKDKYKMHLIDLIDYEKGRVIIVRWK